MSRFISVLLAKEKNSIRTTLEKLEIASGESLTDARLTSEIIINSRLKMRQLGLDPEDTTPEELHAALVNLVSLHNIFLEKTLGIDNTGDTNESLPKICKFTNAKAVAQQVWAIKPVVAKRLLKAVPPKDLMKKLGYRSVDSMLKRESIFDLYAGVRLAESSEYIKKFYSSFKKLSPSDFETRKMAVRHLTQKKWLKLSSDYTIESKSNVIDLKELGVVVVSPLPNVKLKGATIMILPLILHKLNEIHLYSSYFKFIQVKYDFGEILSKSFLGVPNIGVNMVGQKLNWQVVRDHFGDLVRRGMSDVFEPHIQPDDLEKNSVEESLYQLEPALHFWLGNDCLGLPYRQGSVSFNIMDVATSYVNGLDFGQNCTKYLQNSLWDEILKRYLKEGTLQDQVLQQIDNRTVEDEFNDQVSREVAFA